MTYCGTCNSDPCYVYGFPSEQQICCHDMVRWGYCSHEPLQVTEEEAASPDWEAIYDEQQAQQGELRYRDGSPYVPMLWKRSTQKRSKN